MTKDKHPFTQEIQIYDKGAKVQNRFGGDSIDLNALELSIYDTIIGWSLIIIHNIPFFNISYL